MADVTPHACRAIFAILVNLALPVELLKYHEIDQLHYWITQLTP